MWAEKEENSNVIMVSYVNELGTEVVFSSGSLAFSNFGTRFGAVYCTACLLSSFFSRGYLPPPENTKDKHQQHQEPQTLLQSEQ